MARKSTIKVIDMEEGALFRDGEGRSRSVDLSEGEKLLIGRNDALNASDWNIYNLGESYLGLYDKGRLISRQHLALCFQASRLVVQEIGRNNLLQDATCYPYHLLPKGAFYLGKRFVLGKYLITISP
jgi:hypothetical protein